LASSAASSVTSPVPPGLIVNADDLGIHPSINAGIVSAYRSGILTSCTMLMTTAYFDQTIRDHVRPQALPIGIHLSLTLGKAVAPRDEIPDLVDEDGNLKLTADRLILSAFKGERGGAVLRQIGREFEAQLAIARDHGLKATHADSHQHVHMNPAIFRLLEALLPRFGIDRLRFSREAFRGFVLGPDLPDVMRRNNFAKWALLRWRAAGLVPALATTDDFFGVLYSGAVTKRAMLGLLRATAPGRSLEICIHPGFPAPEGVRDYPRPGYNAFISAKARQVEHDLLADPDVAGLVRERGFALRSFDGTIKA
jgi:chitin disaccharide deacetylase